MKLATLLIGILVLGGCSTLGLLGTLSDDASDGILIEIKRDRNSVHADIKSMIMRQEGFREKPYKDAGGLAIGYGTHLNNRGISKAEAYYLMSNDVERIGTALESQYKWVQSLDHVRYGVLVSMAYNLGLDGLSAFDKMLSAMERRDYVLASTEMRLSKWCGQVGPRCTELAYMMENGHAGA